MIADIILIKLGRFCETCVGELSGAREKVCLLLGDVIRWANEKTFRSLACCKISFNVSSYAASAKSVSQGAGENFSVFPSSFSSSYLRWSQVVIRTRTIFSAPALIMG
jgi:hypothetical protein